jgi:branched-chain amino acid transport system ATP-binding protein
MLSVESLEVAYGQVQVLFGVDLTVQPGQIVALLGPNGAGKTTLLRAISGLEPTIGGRVLYNGLDVTKTKPTWRAGMGLQQIVGGEAVAGSLTVEENLRVFANTVPAKALMVRPQLLLIDEFSLGLAPTVIADLLPMVRRIADGGTAVLLVEQSVQIALSIAEYAYVMEKGEIAHSGDAAELLDQPDLLRAAYLEGLTQALAGDDG